MDSRTLSRWGPLIAVVLFSLVGGYALENAADNNSQTLRNAVVESCERINVLRKEVNLQTEIMKDLTTFTADIAASQSDIEHAREYRDLVDQMQILELVNCEEEFPRFSLASDGTRIEQ